MDDAWRQRRPYRIGEQEVEEAGDGWAVAIDRTASIGWIDLKGLLSPRESSGVDVLNGIAYDAKGDRLFVTGKLWPRVFEIKVK